MMKWTFDASLEERLTAAEDALVSVECAMADLQGIMQLKDHWDVLWEIRQALKRDYEALDKEYEEARAADDESIWQDRLRA